MRLSNRCRFLGYSVCLALVGCSSSGNEDETPSSSTGGTMGSGSGGRFPTGGSASNSSGGSPSGGPSGGGAGSETGGVLGSSDGGMQNGSGGQTASGGRTNQTGGASMSGGAGGAEGCVIDLNCRPAPLESSGDFAQDCVDRINQFRVGCYCLPPLERWSEAEECATANAEYDKSVDSPHAGWGSDGVCSENDGSLAKSYNGMATNECPGYGSSTSVITNCIQQMYLEGAEWAEQLGRAPRQSDYEGCGLADCYSKYGHFIAMTNTSYSKVACGITEAPQFWSVQNYR